MWKALRETIKQSSKTENIFNKHRTEADLSSYKKTSESIWTLSTTKHKGFVRQQKILENNETYFGNKVRQINVERKEPIYHWGKELASAMNTFFSTQQKV